MKVQFIGFRISLRRLEGKWKLNQNHPPARRRRTIAALQSQPGEAARDIAELMTDALTPEKP